MPLDSPIGKQAEVIEMRATESWGTKLLHNACNLTGLARMFKTQMIVFDLCHVKMTLNISSAEKDHLATFE